jgi:CRP/FNR family transcriptional regulator, nitrogen oxide reductase regulator
LCTIAVGDRASRHHPNSAWGDSGQRLRRCPLFQGVAPAELRAALQTAVVRRVKRGGSYFRLGDRALGAYILTKGRVKLVRFESGGRRGILRFVSPLEPFGLEAALGDKRHMASALASEDSEALAWPAATLRRIVATHPTIAHNGLRLMAGHVQGAWERFHGLLTEPLDRRIARALLALGTRIGRIVDGGAAIELRLPRQDLAAFVGATPYAVSRIISRWKRLQIVDAGRGWVIIRRPGLAAVAMGHEPSRRPT